jgi:hypothetical protein
MKPNPRLRVLTRSDLTSLGLHGVAYAKPGTVDGQNGFTIHAADGSAIGFAPTLALAAIATRYNNLELVSRH